MSTADATWCDRQQILNRLNRHAALAEHREGELQLLEWVKAERDPWLSDKEAKFLATNLEPEDELGTVTLWRERKRRKLTDEDVFTIRAMRAEGAPLSEIMDRFDISIAHASEVSRGLKRQRARTQ